jgi:ESF2/ABP1 family protein
MALSHASSSDEDSDVDGVMVPHEEGRLNREGREGDGNVDDNAEKRVKKPKRIHKLSLTETENFNEKLKKRGVLYIARIPPRMTPTKVKSLLSDFGEVTRVYLVEEDASVRKRRKKEFGGSGGKRYIEGWVEFASKRKAKHVALSLNNTPITNQKRSAHFGTHGRTLRFKNEIANPNGD